MRSFILALQFLTIINLVPNIKVDSEGIKKSTVYFPLVGLILGLLVIGFDWAIAGFVHRELVGILVLIWLIFLQRGLHLDGLGDTFDGLGSGKSREKILEIMKDSRSGTYSIIAICSLLILKANTLGILSFSESTYGWKYIIVATMLSRWGILLVGAKSRYAREGAGLGSMYVGEHAKRNTLISACYVLPIVLYLLGLKGGIIMLMILVWTWAFAFYFNRLLGGVTGDVFGAYVEITECMILLAGTLLK